MGVSGPSSRGAADGQTRVFISYSRKDLAFIDRLAAGLEAHSITPKIDRSEIYSFEDWWKRIQVLIAEADTVIFVLSPDSVGSGVCQKEVAHALSLHKRFAPIVCRSVANEMDKIPPTLASLNFIFFDAPEGFDAALSKLVEALSTDITWLRKQTQVGLDAMAWVEGGRPNNLLLRSPHLEEAERWIASRPINAPVPSDDSQSLIFESRRVATRRRNILASSLGAGLIVALGLAAAAVLFGLDARHQKGIADQKTIEARLQRDAARKAKTESDQRASLLAANVATKYMEKGAYPAASLLLIDAAKAFSPADTPDAWLIASSNLVDKLEQTEEINFPPHSRVIDTEQAVFITNDGTRDVWTYNEKGLIKLIDGKQQSAGLMTAAILDDGSYIFLTVDQKIEMLCRGCKQPKHIAELASLAAFKLHSDEGWHSTALVFGGTWLIRESPVESSSDPNYKPGTIFDLFNIKDRKTYRVTPEAQDIVPAGHVDGADLFFDGQRLLQLRAENGRYELAPVAAEVDAKLKGSMPFEACLKHFSPAQRAEALKEIQDQNRFDCRSFGAYGLVTMTYSAASADVRDDLILHPDGHSTTVSDYLSKNNDASGNNVTSVTVNPATNTIAAAQDNNIFLIPTGGQIQVIKNETAPSALRFMPDGRLAVIDGPAGHIRLLQPGATHVHSIFPKQDDGPGRRVKTYHIGGCPLPMDGQDPFRQQAEGPDGKMLSFDAKQSSGSTELTLSMWNKSPISSPRRYRVDAECLQISRDFGKAMLRKGARLSVYFDFKTPIDTGEAADLPIDAQTLTSAVMDDGDGSIIVTDGTSNVVRWVFDRHLKSWTSAKIFEGDRPIGFAEADSSGRRLIVQEQEGMGVEDALMYSLPARERWFDLGGNYRMFSVRFTRDGDIAVFKDYQLSDIFHILAPPAYTELLRQKLPPRCQYSGESAARSPCWPLSAR